MGSFHERDTVDVHQQLLHCRIAVPKSVAIGRTEQEHKPTVWMIARLTVRTMIHVVQALCGVSIYVFVYNTHLNAEYTTVLFRNDA